MTFEFLSRVRRWWAGDPVAAAVQDAYRRLTPEAVEDVVASVGKYVADRGGRPGRASEQIYPKEVIELAFIKVLREWPKDDRFKSWGRCTSGSTSI